MRLIIEARLEGAVGFPSCLHAVTFELSFGTNGPFIVSLCFVALGVMRFCHPISQAHVVTQ